MGSKSISILWVDDQIEHLTPYCDVLREKGYEIVTASTGSQALEIAQSRAFDNILVDLRMPSPDGIEILRKLHNLDNQSKTSFGVFSSFHYLQEYRDRLRGLGFYAERIDKDFPPIDSQELVQRFIQPIQSFVEHRISHSNSEGNFPPNIIPEMNPFDVSLDDFLKLSLTEKEQLLDQAADIASATIRKAFDEGKIWVLLCGAPNIICAYACEPSKMCSEEEVLEYARKLKCAPYQYFKSLPVEDIATNFMNGYYPAVTLEFWKEYHAKPEKEPTEKWEKVDVHFDTGAPMSFFSYEDLLEIGAIPPTTLVGGTFDRKGYKGNGYRAIPLNLEVILECQLSGGTRSVRLFGQIVRSWLRDSPYVRLCDEKCMHSCRELKKKRRGNLCRFRKGLVGANLLTDNYLSLLINGAERKTGFLIQKKEEDGAERKTGFSIQKKEKG